ncbi:RhoGAP domain protein, partial [Teladorsagia circumcincta]
MVKVKLVFERKSPKQSTLRECRSEIERGLVPDYKKYGTHVLASVLKISACKTLLGILPKAHAVLLTNVLKLLSKIASSPSSKMTASALSVCLAPSFLESSAQSSDPLEGGKKIPLLVEFLILNASEVMPPGFNSDNIFSILNSVDHNANHLCSPEPTCSDDEGSQRTPIIEEVEGEPSPSLNDLRDEVTPDLPPRFLEVIHENEGVLSFSDSDDEVEVIRRPLSRASFRSETLRQQNDDTLKKEELLPEKSIPSQLVDERKQPDTPRSPCLKRIHFQRKNNSAGTTRQDPAVIESPLRATTKEGSRSEEPQKPTVHVHPFTPDIPSQEPILRTIT